MRRIAIIAVVALAAVTHSNAAPLTVTLTGECIQVNDWGDLDGQAIYEIGDALTATFQYDPTATTRTEEISEDMWSVELSMPIIALDWTVLREATEVDSGTLTDYDYEARIAAWAFSQEMPTDEALWEETLTLIARSQKPLRDVAEFTFYSAGDVWRDPFDPATVLDPTAYDSSEMRIMIESCSLTDGVIYGQALGDFEITGYAIVPEPTAMLLVLAGATAALRRRR